jgi:succinate dehydrogenase flavin-adding protein (antitoxin of CptAB toxin-antitoxin module)
MSLVTQHGDELINTIGSRDSFNRVITRKLVNNNAELNHYISHQIDNIFEQKIQNHLQVIARNLVQNNEELKQYIDQGLQHSVTSNTEMNNQLLNLVANSTEMNNQLLNLVANSTETNNKIENLRNDWNQTFMSLVIQHVDELINIIGNRETFNRLITQNLVNNNNAELNHYVSQQIDKIYDEKIQNYISVMTQNISQEMGNTYINQLITTKNELTGLMNNADRNLYEWTLGELMVIKGCLSDREVLVEQLVTFSAQLRTKLDGTACVDINTFKPFKPISIDHEQQP